MIPDTSYIAGYTILREEPNDAPPDLSNQRSVHPLDPLSIEEIRTASKIIRDYAAPRNLKFNFLSLREPAKAEYQAFRAGRGPRPARRAFAVVLIRDTPDTAEVLVNLDRLVVENWQEVREVGPMLTLEDLDICERVARADPKFQEACHEIGIFDMENILIDGWAIGFDHRWGMERRLQQGLVYYRNSPGDNHYAHPLDLSVVIDTEKEIVLAIDIRRVNGERTLPPLTEHNYTPEFISGGYRHDRLKPIEITQPEGVSFSMRGNELSWAGYKMHVGFNCREGIVLSDVSMFDEHEQRQRALFNRISVVEMVVPYGNPSPPHHRKHAFDVGEYGSGFMSNSLELGCDCKGAIHYIDAVLAVSTGEAAVIKNAICIHEEDNGLAYKHTDFRTGNVISARDRKLIISQIITAANYDYGFYHIFKLDGTYRLEMKLTGMLNTYLLHSSESAAPYGTEVAPGIVAHNHQHIFSLRVDPEIDGPKNSVVQNDAVLSDAPLGSPENPYGNGFYCKKTPLLTAKAAAADYCHETSRSWDIINRSSLNPSTGKPVAYKILNSSSPRILAKPGSTVWNRAAFAQRALWVVPYEDWRLYPAGDYVPQSSGEVGHPQNPTVADWTARDGPIDDADIVCYVQFGLTHFPRTEDFPVMPVEPVGVTLRASNFFVKNPALWLPPSQLVGADKTSRDAFAGQAQSPAAGDSCCQNKAFKGKL